MKPRERFDWRTAGPKKPPPEHGIRIDKAGTTWWGQRWIGALQQVLEGDAGRLSRGKTYARAGRTHDLVVEPGAVTAQVTGSRPTPYQVRIELSELSEAIWQRAIAAMAAKAQFSAELLAGQMPTEIDQAFRDAGVSLFPRERADLKTSCSCPDWGDPCKHVAAAHYVLGEAFDRDPFLIFELRGKTKSQVLAALRAARGASEAKASETPGVKLGKVSAADYDRPRQALPALGFSFDQPSAHGAALRQLGTPAAWKDKASPADVLSPLVRAAADAARRIAMADAEQTAPEPPAPAPETPPQKRARKMRKTRR